MKAEEHPLSQKPLIERITPGPWTYDKENQIVNARSMRGHGEFMLADIRGWGHLQYVKNGDDIQDANGEAIARVPELLKAEQERNYWKERCETSEEFWGREEKASKIKIQELEETISEVKADLEIQKIVRRVAEGKLEAILKGLREITLNPSDQAAVQILELLKQHGK